MSRNNIQARIKKIAEQIGKRYKPEKVILFGSYAHGTHTEHSDIDLLVIKNTRASRVERFVQVKRLIYDPQLRIPVVYTPAEIKKRLKMGDDFLNDILREGKVLYEAGS